MVMDFNIMSLKIMYIYEGQPVGMNALAVGGIFQVKKFQLTIKRD